MTVFGTVVLGFRTIATEERDQVQLGIRQEQLGRCGQGPGAGVSAWKINKSFAFLDTNLTRFLLKVSQGLRGGSDLERGRFSLHGLRRILDETSL